MSSNPFRTPQASPDALASTDSPYSYRPLTVLTIIVVLAFLADGGLLLAQVASGAWLNAVSPGVFIGEEPSGPLASAVTVMFGLTSALYLVCYLGGGFFFFFWLARANKNARALGSQDMEFTPGWTVGWFFVPFLNLFRPYEAVQEIYEASDPDSGPDDWPSAEGNRLILTWWLFWLAFGITGALSSVFSPGGLGSVLHGLVGVFAAGLAVVVVVTIHRRQTGKHERLLRAPPSGPPSPPSRHRFL